jgi:hypothetical protein
MDFGAQLTQFQQEMHFNSSGAGFGVFFSVKTTRITILWYKPSPNGSLFIGFIWVYHILIHFKESSLTVGEVVKHLLWDELSVCNRRARRGIVCHS